MHGHSISAADVLVRNDDHVSASLGDALAMMDVDAGTYYVLDEVATTLWSRLAEPTRVEDLLASLQDSYDVEPERCAADVLPFLAQLHERGLVRVQAA
ncbi:MAG TPA: PqqD family protein [Solirubrobacteraceae bacterium]